MVIVDVVDINVGVTTNGSSDSLVPSRVEDGGGEIVHTGGVRISLGLSTEDGTVEDNIGDVIESVGLDFNQVRFTENDNLNSSAGSP